MRFFVFYHDGYYENGDWGMEIFKNEDAAVAFINKRIAAKPNRKPEDYMLIEGQTRGLIVQETIKSVVAHRKA